MKVRFTERSIEITKTFADKASHYGTQEYLLMRDVLKDFPDFKVVVKAAPMRRQTYMKGLTYDYMVSYIALRYRGIQATDRNIGKGRVQLPTFVHQAAIYLY